MFALILASRVGSKVLVLHAGVAGYAGEDAG